MPVYEFKCSNCRKPFEIRLSFDEYDHAVVICPHCGSKDVARRIRRVAVAGGDKAHLESMADPMAMSALENDPRTLGKMMREMSSQVGEDMGGEFNEVVGRLERGESPEQIEKSMPDLGSDMPADV
ncbi:MAG: FmdB family zinc ribbon protein [Anaerolineaceae bacterium]